MLVVGYDDGRTAVVEDVGDLVAVQPGVDRHDDETGVPDGEKRLEVLGPVAHHDRDPVAGRQAETLAQTGRRSGRPSGEGTPGRVHAVAVGQSRLVSAPAAVALDPPCHVHAHHPGRRAGHRGGTGATPGRVTRYGLPLRFMTHSHTRSQRLSRLAAAAGAPR